MKKVLCNLVNAKIEMDNCSVCVPYFMVNLSNIKLNCHLCFRCSLES